MSAQSLQRSKRKLEKEGYDVWIVEKWVPFPKPHGHRVDLFNLFDLVAIRADVPGIMGIQCCSDNGGDVAEHHRKAIGIPVLKVWVAAGNRAVIHGWGKRGAEGKRKVWTCREVVL